MMMNIISFKNISKSYGSEPVIGNLTFEVGAGKVFGLLGPNGAGKTTLMRLMTNITLPNSGQILFRGTPYNKSHVRKIGYMPEERGLYNNMRILEHLIYIAKLYSLDIKEAKSNINHWLDKLGMTPYANRPIGALSKGMSQKIQFIATVIHKPDLLVLDEPFSGLDPISSQVIEREIRDLKSNGTSIILSTHRMDQVEDFCDEVLLINKGSKVIQGTVDSLKHTFKENIVTVSTENELPPEIISKYTLVTQDGNTYYFSYGGEEEKKNILKSIIDSNATLLTFNEVFPRINDIFIKLIKQQTT